MKTSYFSVCAAVFRFGLAWLCVVPLQLVSQTAEYNYATGHVQGRNHVGGLIGHAGDASEGITNSYARGNVTGTAHVGGLIGSTEVPVSHAYSTGQVSGSEHTGGFAGSGSGSISHSYWNTQTSQQSASAGGEGRTTANMTYPHATNTFVDWDFTHVWQEDRSPAQNNGYPLLKASDVYLLSLRIDPPGAGTASGTGYYKASLMASVAASPREGFRFVGWYQDAILLHDQMAYTFTMTGHTSLVARFESTTTSVEELAAEPGIRVYPNPASGLLHVELTRATAGQHAVSLISLTGQTIARQVIDPTQATSTSFRLDGLSPGIYLVYATGENIRFVEKVVVR